VLFLIKKNAPLSWADDILNLMKSCVKNQPELTLSNLYLSKCNIIANSLSQSTQETFYKDLKKQAFSLLFE